MYDYVVITLIRKKKYFKFERKNIILNFGHDKFFNLYIANKINHMRLLLFTLYTILFNVINNANYNF